MSAFSYDYDDSGYVYSISLNDPGKSPIRLTVHELAEFLETQNFVCKNNFAEAAELMLVQGKKGHILDPMVIKALDWKKPS